MVEKYSTAKNKDVAAIFEQAREKLNGIEESKRKVIIDTAQELEKNGVPQNMISAEMARELEGYASARYIRACLEPESKQESKKRKKIVIDNSGSAAANEDEEKESVKMTHIDAKNIPGHTVVPGHAVTKEEIKAMVVREALKTCCIHIPCIGKEERPETDSCREPSDSL